MCFWFRLCSCSRCSMDARKMMPYWRNFQSLLILLINFIQFLELTLVHKFMLCNMTLNNDIYFVVIVFLQYFFCLCYWAVLLLNFINYILITNVSFENNYFYYMLLSVLWKIMTCIYCISSNKGRASDKHRTFGCLHWNKRCHSNERRISKCGGY